MRPKPRVGLVLLGAHDLTGGGGAERYFADLFTAYRDAEACRDFDIHLITDPASSRALAGIGRNTSDAHVRVLPSAPAFLRVPVQAFALWRLALSGTFDLIHITLALPRHLPWLWALHLARRRARLTLNINDSILAHTLLMPDAPTTLSLENLAYRAYFKTAPLDGLLSWYELFVDRLKPRIGNRVRVMKAARFCFVDTARFAPAPQTEKRVVWAGRLIELKRPELFVEAVAIARAREPAVIDGWEFLLLGKGPLNGRILRRIDDLGLSRFVTVDHRASIADILACSRIFVSVQDYENFTSLVVLEAMACGNAIIARDVGQTRSFVRDGCNGLLIADATPDALADALIRLLNDTEMQSCFAAESRRITLEEHCAANVLREFDDFWRSVLAAD
jgi:glycosyltransferase involved in cell wall biosynthesis